MNISRLVEYTSYLTGLRLGVISAVLYFSEVYFYGNRTTDEMGLLPPVVMVVMGTVVSLLTKKELVTRNIDYRFARVLWCVLGSAGAVLVVIYLFASDGLRLLTLCLYIGGVLGVMMNPIVKDKEENTYEDIKTEE